MSDVLFPKSGHVIILYTRVNNLLLISARMEFVVKAPR